MFWLFVMFCYSNETGYENRACCNNMAPDRLLNAVFVPDYAEDDGSSESGSGGLSAGAIAGIVFGCLATVLIAVLIVMYWADRKGGCKNIFSTSTDDQTRLA